MASGNKVEFVIGAQTGDATAKIAELKKSISSMASEATAAAPHLQRAGNTGLGALSSAMREFKREQVQQNRLVGFYVRELVEFTGAGKQAKEMMGALGGVLVEGLGGGLGFGMAIEAVKAAVILIRQYGEETRKAIEDSDKVIDAILKRWEDRIRSLNREIAVMRGGAGAGTAYDLMADLKAIDAEIKKLKTEHYDATGLQGPGEIVDQVKALEMKKIQVIREANVAARKEREKDEAEQKKRKDEEAQQELERARKRGAEEARAYAAAFAKASREFDISAWQATKGVDYSQSQGPGLDLQSRYQGMFGDAGGEGATYMSGQGGLSSLMQRQGGKGNTYDPERLRQVNEAIKQQQKELQGAQKVWSNYGQKVGNIVSELISGHKKWGQAIKEVIAEAIKALIQYAIKTVVANAFSTGAKVENQWADKGPYGWLIGLGQAAAAIASTLAFRDNIGSAAGGWDLPSGGTEYPAILHPKEMVLPAEHADTIRSLKGGGGLNVTIHANDAQSFMEYIEKNPRMFQRAIQRATRAGGMS